MPRPGDASDTPPAPRRGQRLHRPVHQQLEIVGAAVIGQFRQHHQVESAFRPSVRNCQLLEPHVREAGQLLPGDPQWRSRDIGRQQAVTPLRQLLGQHTDRASRFEPVREPLAGQGAHCQVSFSLLVPPRRKTPRVGLFTVEVVEEVLWQRGSRHRPTAADENLERPVEVLGDIRGQDGLVADRLGQRCDLTPMSTDSRGFGSAIGSCQVEPQQGRRQILRTGPVPGPDRILEQRRVPGVGDRRGGAPCGLVVRMTITAPWGDHQRPRADNQGMQCVRQLLLLLGQPAVRKIQQLDHRGGCHGRQCLEHLGTPQDPEFVGCVGR